MVTHELRNCLGAVRIAASLIKLKRRQPAAAENARLVIERQAAQMAALINDLLEVALLEVSQSVGGWPPCAASVSICGSWQGTRWRPSQRRSAVAING